MTAVEELPELIIEPKVKPFGERARRFAARSPKDDARINILIGSVRSSKTWATFPKILALCRYPVSGHRVITGVSKQAIYQNILTDLFDIAGKENYHYNRQSGELNLFGATWLVIGARDEGSEKAIRGITIGAVVADELVLMPRNFYLMLVSRMSPKGARLYATTNPDSPFHYVKTEIIDSDRLEYGLGKDLWWETWNLDDNINLSDEYREFIKRSYSGVFYERFILGKWIMASGAIYREALTEETYFDDDSMPRGLTVYGGYVERWVSIDAGVTNPQAYGMFYDDGRTVWLTHEYYWDSQKENRQKTDAEYAKDLISGCDGWPGFGESQRFWPAVLVDPSAASFKVELASRGVYAVDADNQVIDGISRVATMLSQRKLRIHKRCVNIIRDLASYSWDEKAAGRGEEKPIKAHDHGADLVRYFVESRINSWRLAA